MENYPTLYILASDKYIFNLNPQKKYPAREEYGKHTLIPLAPSSGKMQKIEVSGEYGTNSSFPVAALDQVMYRFDDFNSNIKFNQLIRVTIPSDATVYYDEIGHHDSASNISFYEGYKASAIQLEESFQFSSQKDMDKLIAAGFFTRESYGGLTNREEYSTWLVRYGKHELYKVYSEYFFDTDRGEEIRKENGNTAAQYGQVELVQSWIEKGKLTRFEYTEMFNVAIEYDNWFIAILLKDLTFRSSSTHSSLLRIMERGRINLFRKITENYDLLNAPGVFIPLLRHALLTGNENFFEKELRYLKQNKVDSIYSDVVSLCCMLDVWPGNEKESENYISMVNDLETSSSTKVWDPKDEMEHFRSHCERNNFFFCCSYLKTFSLNQGRLNEAYLIACEFGALGLVKVAVEYGADIHHWMNYGMMHANRCLHLGLKEYLLGLGMEDESF